MRPSGASQTVNKRVYEVVMSPSRSPFPERLKAARLLREMSQGDLATKAKLPASGISHFETGSRKPSFENLNKLADALDVSTDYLLGRVEAPDAVHDSADALFKDFSGMNAEARDVARDLMRTLAEREKK